MSDIIVSPVVCIARFASLHKISYTLFVFLDANIIPDAKLFVVASDDAYLLGILSSRIHEIWALASGGRLGAGGDPVYVKSSCFDTFPFPEATEAQKSRIRTIAEQLDGHRKTQQTLFPKLTLTAMYRVLEKSRAGEQLSVKERKIADQAGLQELQRLHDELDAAVADAYGWEVDLDEQEVLRRLLELNLLSFRTDKVIITSFLKP